MPVDSARASILGSVAGASHVRTMAAAYGARAILHTDHCPKNKLDWISGLLDEGEQHFAAAFGKVHGVYKPGNVKLTPTILRDAQAHIHERFSTESAKPINFVFHGGSGSSAADIEEAISYGVIKMNIDTDLQWAFWNGVRTHEADHHDYLQGQLGNPEGADVPNKKHYDPRVWLRAGEESFIERLERVFAELNNVNTLA